MAIYTEAQKRDIILNNPNKVLVDKARAMHAKYVKHTHGVGHKQAIRRIPYVEDETCYGARREYAVSNKDLFKRVLIKEDMVFTATGGSAFYGLPKAEEKQMHALTDDVVYGMSLHKWVHTFALQAYRSDPMGLIFMEADEVLTADGEPYKMPRNYPTYKSTNEIFDYLPNGRRLEHVVFALTREQLVAYGVMQPVYDAAGNSNLPARNLGYFRFVDDVSDTIYQLVNSQLVVVPMRQKNPITLDYGRVPAFIVSDLYQFDDPLLFGSPLQFVIEIADSYMHERSVRDLHKKLHGFPKAVEPLMACTTCSEGGVATGRVSGRACPDCTIPGHDVGTGFKLKTTPADVARFPLEMLEHIGGGFKVQDIFGYITPDVEGLNMMNMDLKDLEALIIATYWGTEPVRQQGYNGKQNVLETATKTVVDMQPIYARLNMIADWAENCERQIADFIGTFWFKDQWKGANIILSRNYILELPEDILAIYHEMLTKGTPEGMLDAQFKKYICAVYKGNPERMAMELKLFDLQPFPHTKNSEVEKSPVIPLADKIASRYYGEFVNSLREEEKQQLSYQQLKKRLDEFIAVKMQQVEDEKAKELEAQPANNNITDF